MNEEIKILISNSQYDRIIKTIKEKKLGSDTYLCYCYAVAMVYRINSIGHKCTLHLGSNTSNIISHAWVTIDDGSWVKNLYDINRYSGWKDSDLISVKSVTLDGNLTADEVEKKLLDFFSEINPKKG